MEIQVNRRKFEVPDGETMVGGAISALAGDGRDWVLWEVIPGHDDREVGEYEVLTMPVGGYRRFFTTPRFITSRHFIVAITVELLATYAVAIAALAVVVGLIWWERRK